MSFFQTGLLVIFGFFIIFSVVVFSGIVPIFDNAPDGVGGEVVLWGTVSASSLEKPLQELNDSNKEVFSVRYVEKNEDSFDEALVEALASGAGPDMLLLPHTLIVRHENKVSPISFESIGARAFRDAYAEEGELFLRSDGIVALPFS